ncbi:nematocyst expressed protein 4-like [Adelges cooleyi]|uniref:nematocyst expressed protein 4-like n=1 Tax=Adelges cooleyi TaxID=133065 RepID=UPI0021803700|nr:nematocyst expressed protein 4-like [Adelges cooleyi]
MTLQLTILVLVVLSVAAASETGAGNKEKRQSPYGVGTLPSTPLPSPPSVPNTVPASSINSNYIPVCVAPTAAPYYPSAYNADTSYISQYPAYPAYPSQYPGYQPQYPINPSPNPAYPSPNPAYPSPFPAYPSQYPVYPGLYPAYQPPQYPSSVPYSYNYFSGQNNNVGSPLPNSNIPVSTKKK